jgi:hypothetical protein
MPLVLALVLERGELVLGEGDAGEVGRVARDEGGAREELGVLREVVGGAEGLDFGDDLGFADALQKGGSG